MTEPLRNHGDHGGATAGYAVQAPQWHRASGVTGVLAGDVRKRMGSFPIVHGRCPDHFRNFRFVSGLYDASREIDELQGVISTLRDPFLFVLVSHWHCFIIFVSPRHTVSCFIGRRD